MNLIHASNPSSARSFALANELMPGDWKWIKDARVIREYPRADVYKLPQCDSNPQHADIDAALERARQKRRLGSLFDYS